MPPDSPNGGHHDFLPSERVCPELSFWEPPPHLIAKATAVYERMLTWPRYEVAHKAGKTTVLLKRLEGRCPPRYILGELAPRLSVRYNIGTVIRNLAEHGHIRERSGRVDCAVVEPVQSIYYPHHFCVVASRVDLDLPHDPNTISSVPDFRIWGMREPAVDPEWEDVIRELGLV